MLRIKHILSRALMAVAGTLALSMLLVATLSPWFVTNIDESLPGHFYQIERGETPGRDEVAGIKVPANPYYPEGAPFLKVIKGLPGDVVSCDGRRFFINGEFVAEAKEQTKRGNPLTPGPTGTIPAGHYFIWTPHQDSYDSRYGEVGWISAEHILGKARRLL